MPWIVPIVILSGSAVCFGLIYGLLELNAFMYRQRIRAIFRPVQSELSDLRSELIEIQQTLSGTKGATP